MRKQSCNVRGGGVGWKEATKTERERQREKEGGREGEGKEEAEEQEYYIIQFGENLTVFKVFLSFQTFSLDIILSSQQHSLDR